MSDRLVTHGLIYLTRPLLPYGNSVDSDSIKRAEFISVEQMVIQNVFLAVRSHVHCLFGFSAYIGTNDYICNLATL